ncbi:hypothetical protein [Caldalkalibacillus salinus]|uniref:hypothetical protein n=1 Tax=Caldalkalibacillus salinus TaxID=2803787 RepID=UPI0019207E5F|nr:hypothetical protein [Caldalkalibacillus salinus]
MNTEIVFKYSKRKALIRAIGCTMIAIMSFTVLNVSDYGAGQSKIAFLALIGLFTVFAMIYFIQSMKSQAFLTLRQDHVAVTADDLPAFTVPYQSIDAVDILDLSAGKMLSSHDAKVYLAIQVNDVERVRHQLPQDKQDIIIDGGSNGLVAIPLEGVKGKPNDIIAQFDSVLQAFQSHTVKNDEASVTSSRTSDTSTLS